MVALLWLGAPVHRQAAASAAVSRSGGLTGLPEEARRKVDELAASAEASGVPKRVIVGVHADHAGPSTAPGARTPADDERYQAEVEVAQNHVLTALDGSGARVERRYRSVDALAMSADAAALRRLRDLPGVTSVEEDVPEPAALAESVPLVQGNEARAAGYDGQGWSVAVLDTGVDSSHPFLANKVVAEACFSANSSCPNGTTTQVGVGAGVPCTYAWGCRHGTAAAGVVAGDGAFSAGVAPGATILAVQVYSRFSGSVCANQREDPCTLTYPSDQVAALDWVYSMRATRNIAAVNISEGTGTYAGNCDSVYAERKQAIDNLRSVRIATVAATGNDGRVGAIALPACYSSAVAVSSTDKDDDVSWFANVSSLVHLFAPGSKINTSIPGGGFESENGTSMAAPHVAGAWAVLRQKYPGDDVAAILNRLQTTGRAVTDDRPGGSQTGQRIQIADALGLPVPVNDNFASATSFSASSPSPLTGTSVRATVQPGEPVHAGVGGGGSVWWVFTAPSAGTLSLSTEGSGFDTVLGVYTGSAVNALTEVASNDDVRPPERWSGMTLAASSGQTFRIAVDGFAGSRGSVVLAFTWSGGGSAPVNDNFASGTSFSASSASPLRGTSVRATAQPGEPVHAGVGGGGSVWWVFTAPSTGTLSLSTEGSDFDTVLGVYTGSAVNALTEVASNDDVQPGSPWSEVSMSVASGQTFRIAVDGSAGSRGSVVLAFTWGSAPSNDNFASATSFSISSASPLTGTSVRATAQPGEPVHAGAGGGASVWWVFTAPSSGTLSLSTEGSDFDTVLGVYTGSAVNALTEVASNDDALGGLWSEVTVTVVAGQTYRIAVDGFGGSQGSVELAFACSCGGSSGDRFTGLTPARLIDSRPAFQVGPYSTPWGAGTTRDVQVGGSGGVPADAEAVILNITVTGGSSSSFLTIYPAGTTRPLVSNLNWSAGQTIPNAVTVKLGTGTGNVGKISVFNPSGNVDVIIDVNGYYKAGSGAGFSAQDPVRVIDSRPAFQVGPYSTPWGAGTTRDVQVGGAAGVPADAEAVTLNVTVTGGSAASFLTIYPAGTTRPLVSNLNWSPGQTIPNAVTVKLGTGGGNVGKISVFNPTGNVDVIIDVNGYYKTGTGVAFHPVNPGRVQDSRPAFQVGPYATPWGAGTDRTVQVANQGDVPTSAVAVVTNVTVTGGTAASFLTIYPTGTTRPLVSNLNWGAGQTIPNAVTAKVGTGGANAHKLSVFNPTGTVDVIADVNGWFG